MSQHLFHSSTFLVLFSPVMFGLAADWMSQSHMMDVVVLSGTYLSVLGLITTLNQERGKNIIYILSRRIFFPNSS